MEDEATTSQDEANEEPQVPEGQATQEPEEPKGTPEGATDAEGEPSLTDRHGQPAISRGKYEREMAAKDRRIAELEAQVSEAAKTEASRKELREQIAKLRAENEADRVTYRLELAGCKNVKAAKAVLGDYDGDVDRLRSECPYLFKGDDKPKAGTTGLPNGGAPDSAAERRRRARESAGLKP